MHLSSNTRPHFFELDRGEGPIIFNPKHQPILDFCSQTLNVSLGQCHPAVNEAVAHAMQKITFVSSRFGNEYVRQLAQSIVDVAPRGMNRVNIKVTSGSLANEGALKAAFKLRGKTGVVALMGSHHGQSLGTMRVSGKNFHLEYIDRQGTYFVEPCTCSLINGEDACGGLCLSHLEETVRQHHDELAAIILEPILVDAGVIILPQNYLQGVAAIAKKYELSLLVDEVQTAFGWTGKMFGVDHSDLVPDALTACKGFAAGFPLALILYAEDHDVLSYGEHEITHGAHPLSCAAALANLNLLRQTDLIETVRQNGRHLLNMLQSLREEFSAVEAARGRGMICGIQISDPAPGGRTRRILERCLECGLLLRISKVGERSDVLQMKPPLITPRETLERAVGILRDVLLEVCGDRPPRRAATVDLAGGLGR